MKKLASILLAGLALLASCEKSEEMSAAIAYDKIPGTNIVEGQLGSVVYAYEDWLDCTAGSYYVMDAIYDCYVAKGKTHYVVNPRDGYPDNTNQMMGMEGFLPASLQFHDGYYSYAGGYEGVVKLYAYTFDEASQALGGVFEYHHLEGLPKTLVYLPRSVSCCRQARHGATVRQRREPPSPVWCISDALHLRFLC